MAGQRRSYPQARYWIGTIHADHGEWTQPSELCGTIQWLRGQRERGAGGTEHWQLFVAFTKKCRLAAVKASVGNGHWEPSRSEAAENYVWKEDTAIPGTRFELGAKAFNPSSGTDWARIKDLAKAGRISECLEIAPDATIRHYASLKAISRDFMEKPPDLSTVCGQWIYGPPGVGKSHFAREMYTNIYDKMCNKWWDGYQGQKTVLIDDFDLSHKVLGHHLKRWADKYSFLAESKGHSANIRPDRIIVTSNYKPEDIFDDPALIEAINRRFYRIYIPFRRG